MPTLSRGSHVGPYEIIELIGTGGMGEVYKARDTRLNRTVAIKVLTDRFSARFEREAHAIAALNHPRICTLYDVGPDYLVMEYVEGQPLRGARPLEEALKLACEILDALDCAHRKGVTHRDLKPGNILMTKSGIKLLDFGLARIEGEATLTVTGAVMGTPAYMAPEQLEGKEADERADVYAFGCILYELLSGRMVAAGREPLSHPAVNQIVERCLAMDPDDRWQSAGDVRAALDLVRVAQPRPPPRRVWLWAAASIALMAIAAFVATALKPAAAPGRVIRLSVPPPENASLGWGRSNGGHAISPDGRLLVFATASPRRLWLRPLDAERASELPGTDGAYLPFWSPDGRHVGFFANGKLKRIAVPETERPAPPLDICEAPQGRGGTWNRQGIIVFSPGTDRPLYRVSSSGGAPVPLAPLAGGERANYWPWFLPDGQRFLFTVFYSPPRGAVVVGTVDGRRLTRIVDEPSRAEFAAGDPGMLLFARNGALTAQRFDPGILQLRGEAVPLAGPSALNRGWSNANFSVSDTGVVVYGGYSGTDRQFRWVGRGGHPIASVGEPGAYGDVFRVSPDDSRLANSRDGVDHIWVTDITRGTPTRLTFSQYYYGMPVWSSDGNEIVFSSAQDGPANLYRKAANAGAPERRITQSDNHQTPSDWSSDGWILYSEQSVSNRALHAVRIDGKGPSIQLAQMTGEDFRSRFSPDSRWISYESNESGRSEVYVQRFTGAAEARPARWQITTAGGSHAQWRRDGKELFYIDLAGKLTAVPMALLADRVEPGPPQPLFGPVTSYEAARDGRRFLVLSETNRTLVEPITVLLNWRAALK